MWGLRVGAAQDKLDAIVMELEDLASPAVRSRARAASIFLWGHGPCVPVAVAVQLAGIVCTTVDEDAFKDVDIALLVGRCCLASVLRVWLLSPAQCLFVGCARRAPHSPRRLAH